MAAVGLEGDERAGVGDALQLRDAPGDHVCELVVLPDTHHGHQVRFPGDGVHRGDALDVRQLNRQVGDPRRLRVDQDEGVDHWRDRSGRHPDLRGAVGARAVGRRAARRYHPRVGDVPLPLIRPALELAWAVAKLGEQASPPIPAPGPMRRLLGFAKLPDRALGTARACVESDDAFRGRVAEAADEAALGRASWLWLTRPEAWSEELDELGRRASDEAAAAADVATERRAVRRLAAAESARQRAETDLAALRAALEERRRDVDKHRRARRLAERAADDLRAALDAAKAAADEAAARAAQSAAGEAALRRVNEDLAAALAERDTESEVLRDELTTLRGQRRAEDDPPPAEPTSPPVDLRAAVEGIEAAANAARRLADALGDTARGLGGRGPGAGPADALGDTARGLGDSGRLGAGSGGRDGGERTAGGPARRRSLRRTAIARRRAHGLGRRPVRLPVGVFDDSVEAAAHLVRVPRMLLVVDGYNITLSAWAEEGISDQRHRLVHALAELAMRTPVKVRVVFDGHSEDDYPPVPGRVLGAVRVVFSPTGVDADEVIIDTVASLPPAQPVTVATDDRRVQTEVGARGANVISARQLLGILGRGGAE